MPREICIIGTGMATSVGINAPMTAASVRANISRFKESYMIDKAGEPMMFSMADFISDDLRGMDRLMSLAVPAAKEAMSPLFQSSTPKNLFSQIPVCIGTASKRPEFVPADGDTIGRLEMDTGISFSSSNRYLIPYGHASGLMAIESAVRLIESRKAEFVLAGGIDSYFDPVTLEWLDENKRLHSEDNKDGFIPGEGAGFCLVASADFAKHFGIRPLANLVSAVSGEEPNPFNSDGICIGEGLTKVFHNTLRALKEGEKADWVICDMNGESFRGMEWMYSYLRTGPKHGDPLEIWHPADCYGDIGAASGPVLAGIAIASWQRNYARGNRSLIWTSSDDKQRSAILLQRYGVN